MVIQLLKWSICSPAGLPGSRAGAGRTVGAAGRPLRGARDQPRPPPAPHMEGRLALRTPCRRRCRPEPLSLPCWVRGRLLVCVAQGRSPCLCSLRGPRGPLSTGRPGCVSSFSGRRAIMAASGTGLGPGPVPPLTWPRAPLDTLLSDPSPAPARTPVGSPVRRAAVCAGKVPRGPGAWGSAPPVVWTLLLPVTGALGTHGHWFPYGSLWDVIGLQASLGGVVVFPATGFWGWRLPARLPVGPPLPRPFPGALPTGPAAHREHLRAPVTCDPLALRASER